MANKLHAITGLRKLKLGAKVTRAQSICDAMQASVHFPATTVPVSYLRLQQIIDDLAAAVQAARSVNGSVADTSLMYEKDRVLMGVFMLIRSHVEFVANSSPDPASIIASAGMRVSVPNGPAGVNELTLEAIGGGKIRARVPRREGEGAFVFETSRDGESWTQTASTALAKIVLTGLTQGTKLHVRYYGISKDGNSAVSEAKWVWVV